MSDNSLFKQLTDLLQDLEAHRRQRLQKAGLGVADLRLLWLLSDGRPRTLGEISDELALERSTVNRQVNSAVDGGLLTRRRKPNSTAYLVDTTERGRRDYEQAVSHFKDTYEAALDAMKPGEANQLITLLSRFVEAYGDVMATEVAADGAEKDSL